MSQYDKNQNGVLEKDEVREMSGKWDGADQDKDDRLSVTEVTDQLLKAGGGGSSGGASDSSSSGGSTKEHSSKEHSKGGGSSYSNGSKPFKVMTPADRLPRGLPSWFPSKDTNGDGQVALAEYAPTMSDSSVAEFNKYDLNGDGYIIPSEVIAADKKPSSTTTSSGGDHDRKDKDGDRKDKDGDRKDKDGERKEDRRGFGFGK